MSSKKDYNKTAKVYNQRYREVQIEKYKTMLAGLDLKGKILDHGCGTGLLSQFLNRDLVGIDSSKEMLKIRGSGDLADVEELPYKDAEFDFVLSFTTIQNCKNPEKAIKEVKRVLKLPFPRHLIADSSHVGAKLLVPYFVLRTRKESEAKNQKGLFICTFLRSFEKKLKPLIEKHFKIIEKRKCGEDVGFISIHL